MEYELKNLDWLKMEDIKERSFMNETWIPLKFQPSQNKCFNSYLGSTYQKTLIDSVLFDSVSAEVLPKMPIPQFITNSPELWVGEMLFEVNDDNKKVKGFQPVITQTFIQNDEGTWHLHQDFVISLNLKKQDDKWIRPIEENKVVAKLEHDKNANPILLEVRLEFLRDYLKAKNLSLIIARSITREQITDTISHIDWSEREEKYIEKENYLWRPYVSRMDNKINKIIYDIPASNANNMYRITTDFWKKEIIPPANASKRILQETSPSNNKFYINNSAETMTGDELKTKECSWLYFKPEIMTHIIDLQGSCFLFHTYNTGGISFSSGESFIFGVNSLGLINVYAKDIGKLSEEKQKILQSYNTVPENEVSEELYASQMECSPASTKAPETIIHDMLEKIYDVTNNHFNNSLFREHADISEILKSCHRFRRGSKQKLFELAKSLQKLTVERINGDLLKKIHPFSKENNKGSGEPSSGSIKHLAKVLTILNDKTDKNIDGDNVGRKITASLVGINELRHYDAHLSSNDEKKLQNSLVLVGLDNNDLSNVTNSVQAATEMLESLANSLIEIYSIFQFNPKLRINSFYY